MKFYTISLHTFIKCTISSIIVIVLFSTGDIYSQIAAQPSGSGTSSDPYRIATLDNLYWITQNSSSWSSYFLQTANIDASSDSSWNSSQGMPRIGLNATFPFSGTYDGSGYTITGLFISRSDTMYVGMFGYANSATLKNIALVNVNISGGSNTGGLTGYSVDTTTIENCYTTGSVKGNSTFVGGLSGRNGVNSQINNSYNTAAISGIEYVGGLLGYNNHCSVTNSYNSGSVNSTNLYTGGIAGNSSSFSTITNCFNRGNISGTSDIGGITGYNNTSSTVTNCFSTGIISGSSTEGGVIGYNTYTVSECFWDTTTSGITTGIGGGPDTTGAIAEPTDSMQTESTFTSRGWDFTSTWTINGTTNGGYPYIQSAVPLPVELTTFTAINLSDKIEFQWNTSTEVNNYGFEMQRLNPPFSPLPGGELKGWVNIGFIKGNGNSNSPKEYSFIDDNPPSGTIEYRLKQIDNNGGFKYSQILTMNSIPTKFELLQNYPNPFNPSTTINYQIPNSSYVTLKVYNILGKEVASLVNKEQQAGRYSVQLSLYRNQLSSGVYFYKLTAGSLSEVKKLMLLK